MSSFLRTHQSTKMKEIKCPYCSFKMEVPEHYFRKEIRCVSCGAKFKATDSPKISVDELLKSQPKEERKEKAKPKNKKLILVVAAVLIVLACSVVSVLALSKPNPVKSFQLEILSKIQAEEKSPSIEITGRRDVVITNIEYGVDETSSLISPYIANLVFEIRIYDDSDEVEEELEGILEKEVSVKASVSLDFAFQDYEWVMKEIKTEVESIKDSREIESKRHWGQLRLKSARYSENRGYPVSEENVKELEDIASEIRTMETLRKISNIGWRLKFTRYAEKIFSLEPNEE